MPRVVKETKWFQILYDILAVDDYHNTSPSYKLRENKDEFEDKSTTYYFFFKELNKYKVVKVYKHSY